VQLALKELAADRLVATRRGRRGGTFVSEPAEDPVVLDELVSRTLARREELEELLDYRQAVEPLISGLAAAGRRRSDLSAMRSRRVTRARRRRRRLSTSTTATAACARRSRRSGGSDERGLRALLRSRLSERRARRGRAALPRGRARDPRRVLGRRDGRVPRARARAGDRARRGAGGEARVLLLPPLHERAAGAAGRAPDHDGGARAGARALHLRRLGGERDGPAARAAVP